jgi:hypothetical protein
MKALFFIFGAMLFVSACSSQNKKIEKQVSAEASKVVVSSDYKIQYERAVAEIKSNPELNEDQKKRLINLIDNYVEDVRVLRLKQSQYRSVLLKEMLITSETPSKKAVVAKETLKEINQDAANQLDKFIADFKFITGEDARNQRGLILQVIDTW